MTELKKIEKKYFRLKHKYSNMINLRDEILKALPIPNLFTWWWDNWSGTGFHVWADELLEMEREGIVKIYRGRVELVA